MSNGKVTTGSKKVVMYNDSRKNIYELEKLGAGHDGSVFRLGDKALKILKYDINHRKNADLMTYDKLLYFKNELELKRIEKPIDLLLDADGVFAGYVMNYVENLASEKKKGTPTYKAPGDFTCGVLIDTSYDLEEDFNELTKKGVVAKDINRGSYIYSHDFMHLCDMDKYERGVRLYVADEMNKRALNFTIAKYLYYEMIKVGNVDKQQLKKLSYWVKKSCNSRTFLKDLEREIGVDYSTPVSELAKYKVRKIL